MSSLQISEEITRFCQLIALGRQTSRLLGEALRGTGYSETDFRLLWLLQSAKCELNQKILAAELGVSPAQVTTVVERLRCLQLISARTDKRDRRRQIWQLTEDGKEQLDQLGKLVQNHSTSWDNRSVELLLLPTGRKEVA